MTKADSTTTGPARRRKPKLASRPLVDLGSLTETYAMILDGDCMEPEIADRTPILCDQIAPVRRGDLVIIWIRPEYVAPGGDQAIVKRLVMDAPHVEYPYNSHPDSTAVPVILLERNKPAGTRSVRCDRIAAIHRVIGPTTIVDGAAVALPELVEDARRGGA